MIAERIDFISSYCDRWCERCRFTDRCSAYACQLAIGMCGDEIAGLELAVGAPGPEDGERSETIGERIAAELLAHAPSPEDLAEIERNEAARRDRLDAEPLTALAHEYAVRSAAWLRDHRNRLASRADPIVAEALDVVAWDAFLIGAKVHRALRGRDEAERGEGFDDHPVQNDWNGSAKIALISLERSQAAWATIAAATAEPVAAALHDVAGMLRSALTAGFPNAMAFVRPGFDEPVR